MPRIAIVDDSHVERHFAAACLTEAGFQVGEIVPSSLLQIIHELQVDPPDLLLLDFVIPSCSGDRIARVCRDLSCFQDMRILVYTAHQIESMLPRFGGIQVDGFLRKPCKPKHMADVVRGLVGH